MAKVFVETDDLSKEELVKLLIEKDKKLEELENFKSLILTIYQANKVSDTYRIDRGNIKSYVKKMEDVMMKENKYA